MYYFLTSALPAIIIASKNNDNTDISCFDIIYQYWLDLPDYKYLILYIICVLIIFNLLRKIVSL